MTTDKYFYAVNETIYSSGTVKINSSSISNATVVFIAARAGTTALSGTYTTNSSGEFNVTFSLANTGNYTLTSNVSGDFVQHSIRVNSYKSIVMALNKPTFSPSATGVLTVEVLDINGNGVASQVMNPTLYYMNKTLYSLLSSCTTDAVGTCKINITVPAGDGEYLIAVNNFEAVIGFVVGSFEPSLKITPAVGARTAGITIKVIIKNSGGSGLAASGRQLTVTSPGGTEYTTASMTQYTDDTGTAVTGVYQDVFNTTTEEGIYSVKVTITPQGSNVTRELFGNFEIRGYSIDIVPWFGSSVYYPGSAVSLGVRLRNVSNNEFVTGKASTVKSGITFYDATNKPLTLSNDVTEYAAMNMYKLDFTIPATTGAGTYRTNLYINDSAGSGSANGYFTIQTAKPEAATFDKFNGSAQKEFLSGTQVAARFSARNASGYLDVQYVMSYSIYDENGNDVTSWFTNRANYTASGAQAVNGWINLTTPKVGGWYTLKAKLATVVGDVIAEVGFDVAVLDVSIRPITTASGGGGCGMGPCEGAMGGPGYMFYFKPNDTVRFNVSVSTAQESSSGKEFMGAMRGPGGPSGSMTGGGFGGFGGGSVVSGAKVMVTKIINIQTEEDVTSTATITNGVTDTTGATTITLKSAVNNQQWNGGFYIVFFEVNTTDNQTDRAEGFFEIRRYFVKIQASAATTMNASQFGFTNFNNWNIGPTDNVNVSVSIVRPGEWSDVNQVGNLTITGIYYGGGPGEFVFPPKLISGTNKTILINGSNSTIIDAPSGGWKSGFYLVRATVNISGNVDSGEGFMMSKSFEGWAQPINPTTSQSDFTVETNENVTFQVSVLDVKAHVPAANLTVSLSKIMSFTTFPPSEYGYTQNVSAGTTDSTGRALMTMPAPIGGWSNGDYLAVFSVTNGTTSDTVEGFFQVKPFFVELQPTRWQYASNETISFDVTISSDPSWMRMGMGGGCPPGDPMCGGSGGGGPGGGPVMNRQQINLTDPGGSIKQNTYDLDSDMVTDVKLFAAVDDQTRWVNITTPTNATRISFKGCFTDGQCTGETILSQRFESFTCDGTTFQEANSRTNSSSYILDRNQSSPENRAFCIQTSTGKIFKLVGMGWVPRDPGTKTGYEIESLEFVAGSVGGNTGINTTGGGSIYYNATLKSIKVMTFNWQTGEMVLASSAYNVTSNDEATVGVGNITIPGSGRIKLKPNTPWNGDFFNVMVEFNTSTGTESSGTGFAIASFITNCYREGGWAPVSSGQNISIVCQVTDPSNNGNYSQRVDISVSRLRNTRTGQNVDASAYNVTSSLFTNASMGRRSFNITTSSLSNGQYEAEIRLNGTAATKTAYIWFEIKDFEPVFYSTRWTYGGSDNLSFTAFGASSGANSPVNISTATDFVVYKYDRSTWARTEVTGITVSTYIDQATNMNTINLSRTNGWDEGSYEVVMNLSRVVGGVTQSNKIEVRSWFEVRLFNVWAWSQTWSNYPTDNITLFVGAEQPGSSDAYNGVLIFNVTGITNTRTGAVLTRGTDYTASLNITNPALLPGYPKAARIVVTPLGSGLAPGDYRITIRVTENSTGRSVDTDVWTNVVSYYFTVWGDRWEYGANENVTFNYNAYRPDGTTVNLSNVTIERMDRCMQSGNAWTCNMLNVSSLNYAINLTTKTITINTTGFSAGQYYVQIQATDTRGLSSTTGVGFKIGTFSFNGFVQSMARDYYINESIVFNITGSIGTNVTNATFRYWACPFVMGGGNVACSENTFSIAIDTVLTAQNQLISVQPPLNATTSTRSWPTNIYGDVNYEIDVYAVKDGELKNVRLWTRVRFPIINMDRIVTNNYQYGPTSNINSTLSVYLDEQGTLPLGSVNVSVFKIVKDFGTATPIVIGSDGNWTTTTALTNATGHASILLSPTGSFTWPLGNTFIIYQVRYGSSSTFGGKFVNIYQPTIQVLNKINGSSTDSIPINTTAGKVFDIVVYFSNPTSTEAMNTSVRLSLPINTGNTSYIVSNLTPLTQVLNISANGANSTYWRFNVSKLGNYTGTIYITPNASSIYPSTVPYGFLGSPIP
nr:hypothetical protein [Candidatus Aenigmarchaeota archaeon]